MKKKTNISEFGNRLAWLRRAKGLTQEQLGDLVDVSNRVIAYYEKETKTDFVPAKAALWKKLMVVETLPQIDQKAILHYIKSIVKNREADQKAAK